MLAAKSKHLVFRSLGNGEHHIRRNGKKSTEFFQQVFCVGNLNKPPKAKSLKWQELCCDVAWPLVAWGAHDATEVGFDSLARLQFTLTMKRLPRNRGFFNG